MKHDPMHRFFLLVVVLGFSGSGIALAQESRQLESGTPPDSAAPPPAQKDAVATIPVEEPAAAAERAPARGTTLLHTVVVTASKRRESSRDVPAGITALSGEQLDSIGASRFEDFAYFVPGISWEKLSGAGRQQISLRGISAGSASSATVTGNFQY